MDIRNLPEQERGIYNRIREKYTLTFDKLKVGERTVRILKAADLEEVLAGKDPFADVSEFPFWIRLWEAALVLSYVLCSQPERQGRTLLELGAGLGAPGLAAAAAGFEVTLSDYEEIILDFQRVSCAASGLSGVRPILLDWLAPPADLPLFDVIAGAEVLFRKEFLQPILTILKTYLKPDGVVYLAHDARRKCLPQFLEIAREDFDIAVGRQTMKTSRGEVAILVNCLKRKNRA
ncbi:MAG: methyltransferase [Desulfocapsaceae bacterium]|nr:methyltransferase [Desulfocapsaceae bacterium]